MVTICSVSKGQIPTIQPLIRALIESLASTIASCLIFLVYALLGLLAVVLLLSTTRMAQAFSWSAAHGAGLLCMGMEVMARAAARTCMWLAASTRIVAA